MKIQIKSRFTAAVLFEHDAENNSIRMTLELAIKSGANLSGAYLSGADLNGVCGLNDWIKNIQIEDWPISYTSEIMQIGCQRHPLDAWRNFSDAEIRAMDGRKALTFWRKWRETIFKIIEMAPAQPTKETDPVETDAREKIRQ